MWKKLTLMILLMMFAFSMVSCSEDSTSTQSSDDDIENINNATEDFGAEFAEIMTTEGGTAIMNMPEAELNGKDGIEVIDPKKILAKMIYSADRTGMINKFFGSSKDNYPEWEESWGTFEWDIQYEHWEYAADPTLGEVRWEFPKDESSTVNDARLIWSEFDVNLNTPDTLLNSIRFDLYTLDQGNFTNYVAYLDFSLEYNANQEPTNVTFELWLKPFTMTIEFDQQATQTSFDFTVIRDGNSTPRFSFGAELNYDDINNIEDTITTGAVYFQYGSLRIDLNADIASLIEAFDDPNGNLTPNEIVNILNQYVNGTFKIDGSTVGTLQFFYDVENDGLLINIVFNDGSQVPLEDLLERFFTTIGEEIEEFLTQWFE